MACTPVDNDPMKLHTDALVVDLHSDTVLRMVEEGFDFSTRDSSGHMDLPRLKEGGIDLQVFACWLDTKTPIEKCRATVDQLLDSLDAQIGRNPDKIEVCLTAAEAERIIGDGKIAAFYAIENGVAITNSLDSLDHFYKRGVRYMTLTHTASNDWCISSADTAPAFEGLTDFGRDVVRKMNELGMIIDISHAHPSAVDEVLKLTTDPVIASHSCVYELCPHDRNLTDDQIRAIAANGGVIGINFYTGYLSKAFNDLDKAFEAEHKTEIDSFKALYSDYGERRKAMKHIYTEFGRKVDSLGIDYNIILDHIDYIVKLVGPDYVALGSDFDGVHRIPEGIDDCSLMPNITRGLVVRGYSDDDIKKILGENFMRVFRQVCD
ncbi:MAG: dipeptidase [candidate division Zixibacteria bacterium]